MSLLTTFRTKEVYRAMRQCIKAMYCGRDKDAFSAQQQGQQVSRPHCESPGQHNVFLAMCCLVRHHKYFWKVVIRHVFQIPHFCKTSGSIKSESQALRSSNEPNSNEPWIRLSIGANSGTRQGASKTWQAIHSIATLPVSITRAQHHQSTLNQHLTYDRGPISTQPPCKAP